MIKCIDPVVQVCQTISIVQSADARRIFGILPRGKRFFLLEILKTSTFYPLSLTIQLQRDYVNAVPGALKKLTRCSALVT